VTTIWRAVDQLGREVILTDVGWAHILVGHREMPGREADVRVAVERADFIRRDADRADRECHYRRTGPGGLMLKVVVAYGTARASGAETGMVITAYPTGVVKPKEQRRWP
jgi:hypothetical protein